MTLYADTRAILKRYAEQTAVRTLDALHPGAARRLGRTTRLLTFDVRQADAARSLGFAVVRA